jgi:hypothetical protein
MSDSKSGCRHSRPWSDWSVGAKIGTVVGIVIAVPGLLALCGAVTMWLWNGLMPGIFKLPVIGFWQAVGLLVLSHILLKGGSGPGAGRNHWKKRQVWKHMREDEEAPDGAAVQPK